MGYRSPFATRALSSNSYAPSCRYEGFLRIIPLRDRHSWLSLVYLVYYKLFGRNIPLVWICRASTPAEKGGIK
jgi:hypothetical protein